KRPGSACVPSRACGSERVLAVANFPLVPHYSHGVALRKHCFGATPKSTRQRLRYPEPVVPACVDSGDSGGATTLATGHLRFRNSSTFGSSSRFRRPK